jgi:S1-C subfamily serine protease
MNGRLIGINGKIAVRWGNRANSGVGYAIPTNQIKTFLPHFKEKGEVNHGTIEGVRFDNTRKGGEGAVVRSINRQSKAYEAGLRRGDIIVEADGRGVHSAQRLLGIAGTFPEGEKLPVRVRRGGQLVDVQLLLESRGGAAQGRRGGFLGVRMSNHEGGGVEIEVVVADSPAAKAGIEVGDVVTAVVLGESAHPTQNTNALIQVLSRSKPGDTLTLKMKRGEAELEVEVTLGEPPR